jgi:ATP-binding cassette subfamily B protein
MNKQTITHEAVRQVLKDYFQQYKNNLLSTIVVLLAPAIGSILIFFIPPLIIAKLVNIFIAKKEISLGLASNYILLFGGAWLLGEILWRISFYFLLKIKASGIDNLSKKAFYLLSGRDYDFFTNNFVGSLTKKAMTYSREFDNFTETLSFNILNNILPMLFAMVVLWRYSPWLPIFLMTCLVITTIIIIPLIKKRSSLVILRHEAYSKMSGRLSDSITNMFAVKSFAKEKQELKTYGGCADDLVVKFKKASNYNNLVLSSVVAPIYVITNVIGLILAVFLIQRLNLQASIIIIVFSYYSQVTRFFWEINKIYSNIESSISEGAEFTQLFLEKPLINDIPKAKNLKIAQANIKFNQAYFGYSENQSAEDSFLKDFNLDIKSNQKVGLVGPSGGGKTTITKLILRFIDPQAGNITIDGQDISQVTQASLRQNISYVPQDPLLFHRSLFENIAYGKENATQEEVIRASKLAHADEFISQLPHGYQTLVGERGIKLSGGQRQRVAIARAILKNSPILVLDEATSSLDSESEKYIQEGLWELMKNKTALVIAHRLSTIKHLDRIIVLDQGKIVQDGTHEELIKQKGIYAKLWSHQSGEFF